MKSEEALVDTIHLFGTLDRCLSEMKLMAKHKDQYDDADLQTLKHHTDDMSALASNIRKVLRGEV